MRDYSTCKHGKNCISPRQYRLQEADYNKAKLAVDGSIIRRGECKFCQAEKSSQWREATKEKREEARRKKLDRPPLLTEEGMSLAQKWLCGMI